MNTSFRNYYSAGVHFSFQAQNFALKEKHENRRRHHRSHHHVLVGGGFCWKFPDINGEQFDDNREEPVVAYGSPARRNQMKTVIALAVTLLLATGSAGHSTVRNYFAPEEQGLPLDACLTGDHDCGKPAADAFCKTQGFDAALIFQREAAAHTIRLGNGAFCTGSACRSFKQIKCYAAGGTVTATAN